MKERKWVDIEGETEPKKFVPMNESEETPAFKYQQGASARDSLKSQILATTLFDAVMKYRTNLVKEDNYSKDELYGLKGNALKNAEDKGEKFFARDEWKEFEKHGEIIANFMGASKNMIKQALEKMKEVFSKLGDGSPAKGFIKLNNLDTTFQAAGIDDLDPKIRTSKLLELLSPEYNASVRVKDDEGNYTSQTTKRTKMRTDNGKETNVEFEYSVPIFLNMALNRNKRHFGDYMNDIRSGEGKNTLNKILDDMFTKEFGDNDKKREQVLEIFRKLVAAKDYSKNGSAVGKSEIAFAMFFGDCSLPKDNGDILLEVKNGSQKIEMKGSGAIISNRIQGHKELWGAYKNFKDADDSVLPEDLQDSKIWSRVLSKSNIDVDHLKKCSDTVNDFLMKIEDKYLNNANKTANEAKNNPKNEQNNLKYAFKKLEWKIMFGALMRSYLVETDTMLLLNTADDLGTDLNKSTVMNYQIISVEKDESKNWYSDGLSILDYLDSRGITVALGGRDNSGQAGFKITFRAKARG